MTTAMSTALALPAEAPDRSLEFLRDRRGIYGLSIPADGHDRDVAYILRPDRLGSVSSLYAWAALQPIPNSPVFRHSLEDGLINRLRRVLWARAGFEYCAWEPGEGWWARDEEGRAANRRRYFGLKHRASRIVNGLVGKLIEEAADKDALKMARRFPLKSRSIIYEAVAPSPRALQLAEVFPALALAIHTDTWGNKDDVDARRLMQRGASLAEIAEAAGVPMAMRKVKPGVAHHALMCAAIFHDRPDLLHAYLPATTPGQGRWLHALREAEPFGPPFIEWAARHASEMEGRTCAAVRGTVTNISDWVRACYEASVPDHIRRVLWGNAFEGLNRIRDSQAQFVTRQFSPDMSLRTVTQLSDEWHEAVANNPGTFSGRPFPEPWCEAGTVDGYEISPITTEAELYREGNRMRHCASSYAERVHLGECQIYRVVKNGAPVATAEIVIDGGRAKPRQVAGPCNAEVDPKVMKALRKWLRQSPLRLPKPKPSLFEIISNGGGNFEDDTEIPF